MEILKPADLHRLLSVRDSHCLSLYMPTVRAGREVRQNSIRFGNLVRRARSQLAERGLRPRAIESLIKPIAGLEKDKIFWEQQLEGFALFRTPRRLFSYRLPEPFEELALLGSRFFLKPLIALFSAAARFFVLALSQRKVRLYLGSRYALAERTVQRVPDSLAEAMLFDEVEKQLQYHAGTRGAVQSGRGPVLYHGHGAGKAETKDQVLRYFRKVDRGVHPVLRHESAPLVLVGLEYLFPIYRMACTYPHLLEEAVDANADEMSGEELHRLAWKLVEPVFQRRREEKRREYDELSRGGRTAAELKEIVPAAVFRRVDTLFLQLGEQRWGSFDERSGELTLSDPQTAGSEDLLDLAAVHTLGAGGRVFPVGPEEFQGPAAAILRDER